MAPATNEKFTIWNDEEDAIQQNPKENDETNAFNVSILRRAHTLPSRCRKHPRDHSFESETEVKRRKSTSDLKPTSNVLKTFQTTLGKMKSKRFTFNRKMGSKSPIKPVLGNIINPRKQPTKEINDENVIDKQIKILLSYCVEEKPEKMPQDDEEDDQKAKEPKNYDEVKKYAQLCKSPKKRNILKDLQKRHTSPEPKKLTFTFKCGEKTLVIKRKPRVSLWKRVVMKQHQKTCREFLRSRYGLSL